MIRLNQIVPWYKEMHERRSRSLDLQPIRVAIIDSGVDQGEFPSTVEFMGDSFCSTHWWLSPERHGTQMAKIVKAIDPCCRLFIAKVGDHRKDITVQAVESVESPLPPFPKAL